MSTKTTIKRIALVAVSALGLGLLSVIPASAAVAAYASVTLDNTTTTFSGRVGNTVTITVTGDIAAVGAAGAGDTNAMVINAATISQPSGSTVLPDLADAGTPAPTLDNAPTDTAASASSAARLQYEGLATEVIAETADASVATLTLVPSHIGTYVVRVWNETSSSNSLSGAESYKDFTINVTSGPSAITLAAKGSTAPVYIDGGNDNITDGAEKGAYGALVKITLADAAGVPAALGVGEVVTVDPTLSAAIVAVNGTLRTDAYTAGGAYSLTPADFTNGVAYVNISDEVAETSVVSVSYGTVVSNISLTYKATALNANLTAAATYAPTAATTGWYSAGADAYTVPWSTSLTIDVTDNDATGDDDFASTAYAAIRVKDVSGKIFGLANGFYDNAVINGGSLAIAAAFTADSQTFRVSDDTADTADTTPDDVYTSGARDITTGGSVTVSPSGSIVAAKGGSLVFTTTVLDNFGNAYANGRVTLSLSSTGRNGAQASQSGTTDANGKVSFTLTDSAASTSVVNTDTVTITAFDENSSLAASAVSITWSTIAVSTATLTYPGYLDTIAGTTTTDISAAAAGATGAKATITATLKDANGSLLVGIPVTFTVAGLTGAEVHTTTATAYTTSAGVATAYVSSYAAGKATVTIVAGAVTKTADIYFKQQTATEARTIAAAATTNGVIATVKDRYGNAIEGVTVNATRASGSGFFANGSSSTSGTTDKNGQVEFAFNGSGSVKVAFTAEDYGQSADAAGYVGGNATTGTAVTASAAGTSTTNQKGLGASLAAAGVNSATVDVTASGTSSDAVDAANEATDAANAATDAANAAAEAADAATAAAQDAQAAVAALATQVASLIAGIKAQITTLTNLVIKIQKKVRA